jgi:hypothetical protein
MHGAQRTAAEASFAMRTVKRFGIAIAAMMGTNLISRLDSQSEQPRQKGDRGEGRGFLPNAVGDFYCSDARASQAVSVAGAAPPVGSTWITADSSLQNVRLPVAFTLSGTAPVT